MATRSHSRTTCWSLACVIVVAVVSVQAQTTGSPAVKKQLPADRRAYKAARAIENPEQCLTAMRAFLKEYPKSNRVGAAHSAIFKLLIENFPQRNAEIEAEVKLQVKQAEKGQSRTDKETFLAWQLAEAGTAGLELPLAEKLSLDAVKHSREAAFDKEALAAYAKYKQPAPKAAELRKQFANDRAENLAVLADVYLREGKQAQATPLVAEAYSLDPLVDDVNAERARLALLNHDDSLAIESYERAQLVGAIKPVDLRNMMELYRKSHNGSDAGFTAEMDARYNQIFPPNLAVNKAKTTPSGHTVLLELFTGSACPPCVGGDVAVEGLLETYSRSEFVALAFDQHIPEPDPLANPDSVARADFYGVGATPTYLLDGQTVSASGAARDGSQELYDNLAKLVETNAARSTGVQLQLSASSADAGKVQAHAVVTLPESKLLEKALATKAEPDPPIKSDAKPAPATVPAPVAAVEPHFIVNFALVEDDIRYSGENGVRFHRMVVRALAKPADSGFPVIAGNTVTLDASFDPAAISQSLVSYLNGYEQRNDRFGKITFLTKDTTMQPGHLSIAAWVQDSASHHVLAAALVPLGDSMKATK